MKVLIIPTWYKNNSDLNAGIFILEQALELNKSNEVMVYFPYDDHSNLIISKKYENNIITFRSKWIKSKIPLIPNVINKIIFIFNIKKIMKECKFELVHAHVSTQAGYLARLIYKIFKIPYIITEHSPKKLLILNNREQKKAEKVFRDSFKSIGVSNYICNDLKEVGDLVCIYNGVNVEEKEDCKILNDKFINIAVVASFYNKEIKGINYLLKSITLLDLEVRKKIKVNIIGEGSYKEYYVDLSKKLEVNEIIEFHGYIEKKDTITMINKCDFLVSASLEETFGLAIAEALSLGKPVISTRCGGPQEFVNDTNGILVDSKNEIQLAEAISNMIKTYKNYNKKKLKKYAEDTLSMSKSVEKYREIYNDVNNGRD